ncbi:hypothetical protein ACLF3G_24950 [Falsiroseomonas sp. HC035]|uniref:hypothetical protein n=1 Tax=Falsiroseomonas sp. HC035 TaxID=3390999 RepID=UPI003D31BE01
MPERDSMVQDAGSATDDAARPSGAVAAQDTLTLQRQVQQLEMRNDDHAKQLAQAAATIAA